MLTLLAIFIVLFLTNRSRIINIYWLGLVLFNFILFFLGKTFFAPAVDSQLYYISLSVFIFAFLPFILLLISVGTFFNSKQLMEKEGRRIRNLFISVLGMASLGILVLSVYFYLSSNQTGISEFLYFYIIAIFAYFLWLFTSTAVYALVYNAAPITYEPDYIIVLGSGLIGDRVPPLLASRLDKAAKQYKKYGGRPLLITSGGQGSDELVSEASAMKKYLIETHKLEEGIIIAEEKSTTTFENMTFSKKIIDEQMPNAKGVFVTNNYHVLRASIYARKVGLQAIGRGSTTALYYVPNAFMREFIGFLEMTKWLQISLVTVFTLFWLVLMNAYL